MPMNSEAAPLRVAASCERNGAYWVVVPDTRADVAVVNHTGYEVFELCDGTRTAQAIAEKLTHATATHIDKALVDVTEYLSALEQARLIIWQ